MGNYQGDHGDECYCTSCVRDALPTIDVFAETITELHTASTFEEHMSPDVDWYANPEFDKEFDRLLEAQERRKEKPA